MTFLEALPPSAEARLKQLVADDEPRLITAVTDLAADNSYSERFLVVTSRRLMVLPPNGSVDGFVELQVKDVVSAKADPLVGGGRLEVTTDGRAVEILRYSNSLATKFAEVARGIEQIAKGEELAIASELDRTRCAKCRRLLPEKNGICPACVKKRTVLLQIAGYLKPYARKAVFLAAVTLVGTLVQLVPPYLTKVIIDDVLTPRRNFRLLVLLVLGLIGARLIAAVSEVLHGHSVAWLGSKVTSDLRSELYHCLGRLSLSFYDKRQVGAIMSRVTDDTGTLQGFLIDGLPYLVTNSVMFVGILAVLFSMSWRLTFLILIPTPLLVLGGGFFWKRMRPLFHKWRHKWSRLSAHINESITGIRVVKAFAQERQEFSRFDRRNDELFAINVKVDSTWYSFFALMSFFTGSGVFIVWLMGGRSVIAGEMTFGTLMAFISYLWLLYGPLQWLNQVNSWMSRAFAGAERIFEILRIEPEKYDSPDAVQMPDIKGEVEFEDVYFGYDKSKPVLQGVTLHVKPGEMIGLVGKSGVGKTTLINLTCRFYEPDRGILRIDGVDIRKVRLSDLRHQIGIVLQEPFLFNGTIAENIAYARPEATFEQMVKAARAANAHNFIVAKPDGYDTQVGERGSKLSTGEKQRVSIARAILHDPRILILDEATSSVDTETEKQIQEALSRLVKGRTTFAIAHRLSTLRNADRLVVLDAGKVAEIGTHDELLEKEGIFYNLVNIQQETSKIMAWTEE